jgi:hypothetical protein
MSIFGIFGGGARETVRVGRAVAILWVANVFFSLLGVLPLAFLIDREIGHSFWGTSVRGFDFLWLGEVLYKFRDLPPVLAGWFLGVAGLFFIASVFLTGGVVGRLVAGESDARGSLATAAGLLALLVRSSCCRCHSISSSLSSFPAPVRGPEIGLRQRRNGMTTLIVSNLQFLAVLLVFSIVQMLFDYTKVRLAVDDSYQVLRSLGRTVGFLLQNFGRTWGAYLLVSLFFGLGFVVFINVLKLIPNHGLVPAALGFLWSQAFVLFRLWTRVQYFATAFIVDRERRR